ncbi:MAG TPA: hypothetical protein VFV42_07215 [Acidimicrobiales bacterium]|nr:hypothetical protein [Acidimicrobiales bacterium]
MTGHPRAERVAAVAALLGVVAAAATALPFGRSGQRWRSSYELVDVADAAGVLPAGIAGIAAAWYLVPALAGAVVVAAALRRPSAAGGLATTLGALVGTGSILVGRSPLTTGPAVAAALVLGAGTTLSGAIALAAARKETAA